MSIIKQRISSPLEAGTSILDVSNLPSHLTEALEYTSKRLARKALHITLVVVRRDYQLPSVVPPCRTPPTSPPLSPPPTRFTSPVIGLKQLVRRGTGNNNNIATPITSPTFSPPPTEALPSPRRWAVPPTPGSPPITPNTPCSFVTASSTPPMTQGPNEFGIRLVHTGLLSPKAEKVLQTTILKAERKFRIGTGWLLPPTTTASSCGLNPDLVVRSILQNEVLFSSEGLTLLGLDRLYTFKAALSAYARCMYGGGTSSPSPMSPTFKPTDSGTRLEDAVDSLRRLVLANGGRPVSRSDVYRSYDWLGINPRALRDVESMYRRAYGGPERAGAFELTREERDRDLDRERERVRERQLQERPVVKIGAPPPPKTPPRTQTTPVLTLNTQLAAATTAKILRPRPKPVPRDLPTQGVGTADEKGLVKVTDVEVEPGVTELEIKVDGVVTRDKRHCDEGDGDGDGNGCKERKGESNSGDTARLAPCVPLWTGGISIDELLSPCDDSKSIVSTIRQSQRLGPTTPNGYDDISPITRGEWGFLFNGDGWKGGRTAAVETC